MSAAFEFCSRVLGQAGIALLLAAYQERESQLSGAYIAGMVTAILLVSAAIQAVLLLLGRTA